MDSLDTKWTWSLLKLWTSAGSATNLPKACQSEAAYSASSQHLEADSSPSIPQGKVRSTSRGSNCTSSKGTCRTSTFDDASEENSQRTVVSPPRQKTSTQKDSSQSSSDARANSHPNSGSAGENSTQPSGETGKRLGVSPLRQEESAQKDPAEANQTGQRQDQGRNDEEVLESGDSGIVYMTRDTESVEAHGCWDTFWNWLCYKGKFLNISTQRIQLTHSISFLILTFSRLYSR
ncbi:hypothetical protein DFH29DRAFT_433532 [Suillus ampliporus]|nr:hypothetical protein DFH29DRAFT_433532 [Suillus ampliporus]